MTNEEFEQMRDDLITHLGVAAERFLRRRGVTQIDWLAFWKQASTDHAMAAREILFFAADIWPDEHEEEATS